jgi:hypothetical protein
MKGNYSVRLLAAAVAGLASMAMFVTMAQAATPAPGFAQFAGCPSKAENPSMQVCVRSLIKSGHFQMGNKDVPITNPMVLSGGMNANLEGFAASPKGGLTPVKQQVPGGVVGLTGLDWLVNFLGIEALKLYAVTELVGVPAIGEGLSLPVRVHLVNSALGNNCYVGSPSSPVNLNLIEGTTSPPAPNNPITGKSPEFIVDESPEIVTFKNGTYVDNSFSAPGANGCVLTLFGFLPISINGLVNSTSGLPAAAGTNETVQNIDIELAEVEKVYP